MFWLGRAGVAKLAIPGTKWRDVFRQPIKLIVHARDYHSATDECLFEARVSLNVHLDGHQLPNVMPRSPPLERS